MKRSLPTLLLLALPEAAHACAVCGAAVERSKTAFFGTTILLSLLPLVLIGAGLWWIGRQAGGHVAGEFGERERQVGAEQRAGAGASPAVPGAGDPLLTGPGGGGEGRR